MDCPLTKSKQSRGPALAGESGTIHQPRPRTWERLTFFSDYGHYRGTNPVISDDGRFMAFQLAKATERAGVGHGIFIYEFAKADKR